MPSLTDEDVRIENLDMEGVPPCGIMLWCAPGQLEACGKPSHRKVRAACPCCDRTEYPFICRSCDDLLAEYGPQCTYCWHAPIAVVAA